MRAWNNSLGLAQALTTCLHIKLSLASAQVFKRGAQAPCRRKLDVTIVARPIFPEAVGRCAPRQLEVVKPAQRSSGTRGTCRAAIHRYIALASDYVSRRNETGRLRRRGGTKSPRLEIRFGVACDFQTGILNVASKILVGTVWTSNLSHPPSEKPVLAIYSTGQACYCLA